MVLLLRYDYMVKAYELGNGLHSITIFSKRGFRAVKEEVRCLAHNSSQSTTSLDNQKPQPASLRCFPGLWQWRPHTPPRLLNLSLQGKMVLKGLAVEVRTPDGLRFIVIDEEPAGPSAIMEISLNVGDLKRSLGGSRTRWKECSIQTRWVANSCTPLSATFVHALLAYWNGFFGMPIAYNSGTEAVLYPASERQTCLRLVQLPEGTKLNLGTG